VEVAIEGTHDIREAKMEANSEARHKLLWTVILVLERRFKSMRREAIVADAPQNPESRPEGSLCSGSMIRPSTHQRVEIQTHREDWP
jgi:hypothetical protein